MLEPNVLGSQRLKRRLRQIGEQLLHRLATKLLGGPTSMSLVARASARPVRLIPIPLALLLVPTNLTDALIGSLETDVSNANATEWRSPLTLAEGLSHFVEAEFNRFDAMRADKRG